MIPSLRLGVVGLHAGSDCGLLDLKGCAGKYCLLDFVLATCTVDASVGEQIRGTNIGL
jgi:hypothetical protein